MKILKYNNNNLATDSFGRGRTCTTSKRFSRHDDSFFFRPHIDITNKLISNEKSILIKSNDGNTQEHQVYIISLAVKNNTRFWSKIGNNCFYKIFLSKDNEGIIEEPYELCWKTRLPNECKTDKKENFIDCYRKELEQFVKTKTYLLRGIDKELLFLLTIPSSDSVYLIGVKNGEKLNESGNIIGNFEYIEFIKLEIGEYNVNLVFHSDEYKESKGANYKLNIKGWNSIEFTKIKFYRNYKN